MNFTTFRMPWGQAQSLSDYQGICVKGGELLLSFVGAAQDAIKWPVETPPQRANFRAWVGKGGMR
jgi:hypothetical protein